MAKIERFEDFFAWQKARALTARIYKITNQGTFSRDFSLRDQADFVTLLGDAAEVGQIIGGLRVSVQNRRDAKR